MSVSMGRARSGALGVVWILVLSCGVVDPGPSAKDLEFAAEAELVGDRLHFTLFVVNRSEAPIELESAGCPGESVLLVYEGPTLRWDEREWFTQVPCMGPTIRRDYPSGEQVSINRVRAVQEILGDSLGEGTYRFVIVPHFAPPYRELLSDVAIPVGEFELTH